MHQRTLYIFAFSFLLFIISAFIRYQSFGEMRSYAKLVDDSREIITSLEKLSSFFKSAQMYSPEYGNRVAENFYNLLKRESSLVDREIKELRILLKDDAGRLNEINIIASMIEEHWNALMEMNLAEMVDRDQGWRLSEYFKISNTINLMVDKEERLLAVRRNELNATISMNNRLSLALISVAAITIIITFIINLRLNRTRQWLEGFLESIVNSSQNGIVSYQPVREKGVIVDFKVEYANKVIGKLLHVSLNDFIGKKISELDIYTAPGILEKFRQVVEQKNYTEFENHYARDGKDHWFMVRLSPHGEGLTASFHDITDLKTSQVQLKESIQQLEKSNAELEQYAYAASHDLQEPLRKIQTFGNMLWERQGQQLNSKGQELLQKIIGAAARMSTLIRDVLNFSSLRESTDMIRTDLSTELDNVLQDLELVIGQKEALIKEEALPVIEAIPLQMRQLFYNLINNALKFTANGRKPEVNISCRQLTPEQVAAHPQLHQQIKHFEISIADNGIGFNNDHAKQIFSLFRRLNSKDAYEGSGIGLALCQKVVENHHGIISARGEEGHGASFYIILPANQPPVA